MAGHGLGGADDDAAGPLLAEGFLHGQGLDTVVHGGAGAVGVEIHLVGVHAALVPRVGDGPGALGGLGVGGGHVVGVAGGAIACQLGVDLCAAGLGVLHLLQNKHAGALTHDEAAAPLVEGQGGVQGVLRGGQGLHVGEAGSGQRIHRGLGAAGDHGVGVAVADETHGLANGVTAGGAGRDHGQGRALAAIAHGDHAGGHVGDHAGDKVGGHAAGALFQQLLMLRHEGGDAADAGADVDAEALAVHGAGDAAVLHGLHSGGHGKLGVDIAVHHVQLFHVVLGLKVPDLSGHLDLVVGGIELGDGADAALAGDEGIPESLDIIAHGADNAQTGHCDPFHKLPPASSASRVSSCQLYSGWVFLSFRGTRLSASRKQCSLSPSASSTPVSPWRIS